MQAGSISTAALPLPTGPWTDLARRLIESKDANTAVAVTREILARGGIATADGDRVLRQPIGPAASFDDSPLETVRLAREAQRRPTAGRMSVAEYAQMLETFGWRFKNADADRGASPPPRGQLGEDLQAAVREDRSSTNRRERDAARAETGDEDAERQAAMDRDAELVKQIQDATLAWQQARQAAARAPAGEKAAADARVAEAMATRNRLIEDRNAAQRQASADREARRERTRMEGELETRMNAAMRRIGQDVSAGEQLMEMFALWVQAAAQNPDDPRSFTPLFLAEMARLQDPPVDLAGSRYRRPGRGAGAPVDLRGAARSQQLRLTLLEMQLIAAAFHRGPAVSRAAFRGGPDVVRASMTAASQDPCSAIKEKLEKLAGKDVAELAGTSVSELAGQGLDKAVGAAMSEAGASAFGSAMAALGMAVKIGKLVSFYDNHRITVTPEPHSTHKPPEGAPLVSYTATAGISEEDWKDLENAMKGEDARSDRAMRDCLNQLGMPTAPDLSDLAKEAENWLVEWRLTEGSPPHAWISLANNNFYLPGRLAMKLARSGPYSASAKLTVDILPESNPSGKIVRTYVTAQASLDAAGMPSLGTLLNAMKGALGLADALLELCVGWYQVMNMPKAYGTVEVEYHCPKPTTLVRTNNPIADGGGDEGPQDCLVEDGK